MERNETAVFLKVDEATVAALDAWRRAQPGAASRGHAVRQLIQRGLTEQTHRSGDDPEAAGRAAYETYGPQGHAINPHDHGSAKESRWQVGFARAKRDAKLPRK